VFIADERWNDIIAEMTAVADETALDKADGAILADEIVDEAVLVLHRALPDRSVQALELMLADFRADVARKLGRFVFGLIDRDEYIRDLSSELAKFS
jgi:hypothetical protein